MTSDNCKSQIDFLDIKIIKIKIQALLLLRFNLRFEILLFDSPARIRKFHQLLKEFFQMIEMKQLWTDKNTKGKKWKLQNFDEKTFYLFFSKLKVV